MKNAKTIFLFLAVALFSMSMIACSSDGQEVADEPVVNENVVADASVKMEIEGMVCSMGCVKTIEQGLAKLPGVATCKVDYDTKTAVVTFDSKQVDNATVVSHVGTLHDGLYKATLLQEADATQDGTEQIEETM